MKKNLKKILAILLAAITICSAFTACSKNKDEGEGVLSADKTVNTASSTSENSTVATTEQAQSESTTTKKEENTSKQSNNSTTKKNELATKKPSSNAGSQTTTKKPTTAKKQETTTKKPVTTTKPAEKPIEDKHCTNNSNHSISVGSIGKWFTSRKELQIYVESVGAEWWDKYEKGIISRDEYIKNCPQGYECWSCSYCGKWTGNWKFDR